MADSKTRVLSQTLLNEMYRDLPSPTVRSAAVWVALFTTAPTESSAGVEVSTIATGYTRVQAVQANATWTDPVTGLNNETITNAIALTFPQATGNWGTVVATATISHETDAASVNNELHFDTLIGGSKVVSTGDTFQFAIGDFAIAEK